MLARVRIKADSQCLNSATKQTVDSPTVRYNGIGFQVGRSSIPQVTIKTGIIGPEGREEQLTGYLCDHPGCPHLATHLLGVVTELRVMAAVCEEHLRDRA
jgi:hypothetical protein